MTPKLVTARFVRDILHRAVDVVHRVGHGGNVVLGRAGGAVVVDLVRHGLLRFCRMEAECLLGFSCWGFSGW